MEKNIEQIMHGLTEASAVSDKLVFENMPVFPRISRSKHITLLLVNRLKSYKIEGNECQILAEGVYVDEKYTYRYLDYRQVFVEKANRGNISIRLAFVNEKTVRISMAEGFSVPDNQTEMIKDMKEEPCQASADETEEELVITAGKLRIVIKKHPWNLSVVNEGGKAVYQQFGKDEHSFMPYEICPFGFLYDGERGERYASESVCLDPYEEVYGLGENFTAVNRKGRTFDLWNTNSLGVNTERGYKYIPFYISTNGYGAFYNTSRKIRCDIGGTLSKASNTLIEGGLFDLFIIEGSTMRDILPYYFKITGIPAVPPKWSFGIWMSKISYGTREEVETVAKNMREYELPCDVIHIDTDWFAENWVCDWRFDENKFPDVESMIKHLHEEGYKISLWQLPYIERGNISWEVYDEGARNGYFASNPGGDMQFPHGLIDFTNPEAVAWYKNKLIKPLLRLGIDVIKVDFGESAPGFFQYAGKEGAEMHNLYALLYNKAAYEAAVEELGEEQALIWARSAWAGSQKYPVHWGGDAGTDFGSLASSLKGCLNASVSGIPFWSSDIGGFWFDTDPVLYIRWLQFGMFCSHARFHGFYTREPWAFGEDAVRIYRKYAAMRYRLLPYIYNQALAVKEELSIIHRPMAYEFTEDFTASALDTQYLFGKELLVVPVLNREGKVKGYLPKGMWTDLETDCITEGGIWISDTVELDKIPVYVRENAIIPMGPVLNYVGETENQPYEVHCYPGIGENHAIFYEIGSKMHMTAETAQVEIRYTSQESQVIFVVHNICVRKVETNGVDMTMEIKGATAIIRITNRCPGNEICLTIRKED